MNKHRGIWMAGLLAAALAAPGARAADGHGGHSHGKPAAGAADDHAAKGAAVTLEGEVLDLHCFMLHPESGQGADHASCAKMCMNKGLPIGFLSGGQVYLLLGGGHDSVKSKVVKDAGYPVTLKGTLVEHHGVKAIQVSEVRRAGTKPAAAKPADQPAAKKKDVWMCPMGCAKSDKPGKCPSCGMDMDKQKG